MKINKILAAGVAATLAVTSLSAVVSAEVQTKTFDVYRTTASFWNSSIKFNADVNKKIAQKLSQVENGSIVLTQLDEYVREVLNYKGFLSYLLENGETDLYSYYAADPARYSNGQDMFVAGVSITATGYQHVGDTATVTKTFKFEHTGGAWGWINSPNGTWTLTVLDDETPIYHDGEFASYFFTEITSLQLEVQLSGQTLDENEYNYWSFINNAGDNSKRFLDIGDILVNGTKANPLAGTYTYGRASEANNGTDYTNVLAEQATDDIYKVNQPAAAVTGATAAANAGKGVLVGTPITAGEGMIGKTVPSTTALYVVDGDTLDTYTAAAADPIAALNTGAAGALDTTVTADAPVVVDNSIKTTGYVYKFNDGATDFFIYSATTISADDLTALGALATRAAVTAAGYTLLDAAAAADQKVILNPVNKDVFNDIIADAASVAANGTAANAAVVDNGDGTWSLVTVASEGVDFSAVNYTDAMSTGHLLGYAFANGGWFESKGAYGDNQTADWDINTIQYGAAPLAYWYNNANVNSGANGNTGDNGILSALNPGTSKENGWLPKTTNNSSKTIKNKIERTDVWELSNTREYQSTGQTYALDGIGNDDNQSYNATFWDGTNPYGFAGLASQVADFFNKQDNGTITFTFAADAGSTAGKWTDGVPSTEVGLKGFTSEYLNDFALFFNYRNTTGTMLSALKLDPTAGTVTFDISDYLKDCGGLTKATLENIYYGLDNGIKYNATTNKYGLWVSKVELAYDDAGVAVDANTDDDAAADDDAAVVVADDDDDDVIADDDDDIAEDDDIIEDDDDDDDDAGEIIEDDDDDDDDVNNDVDYVDADDDANPGTGVGLAVIPAIVAGAALVVSKKRK